MTAKRNDNLMTVFEKYFSGKVSFSACFRWGRIFDLKNVLLKLDNYTVDFFYFEKSRKESFSNLEVYEIIPTLLLANGLQ